MLNTRFDLEREIMNCWCITDDLELIKGDKESIEALRVIYELKFQKMFNIFEQLIQEKKL